MGPLFPMRANQGWEASKELCRPMLRHSTSEHLIHRADFWDHFCNKYSSGARARARRLHREPAPEASGIGRCRSAAKW
eukprot:1144896-Pelagomonas_calceolata.AAC.2